MMQVIRVCDDNAGVGWIVSLKAWRISAYASACDFILF